MFTVARYLSYGDYLGYLHIKWLKEQPPPKRLFVVSEFLQPGGDAALGDKNPHAPNRLRSAANSL